MPGYVSEHGTFPESKCRHCGGKGFHPACEDTMRAARAAMVERAARIWRMHCKFTPHVTWTAGR